VYEDDKSSPSSTSAAFGRSHPGHPKERKVQLDSFRTNRPPPSAGSAADLPRRDAGTGATAYNISRTTARRRIRCDARALPHHSKLGARAGIGWRPASWTTPRPAICRQDAEALEAYMRAIEIQGAFGLDNLALVERPDPRPGPGRRWSACAPPRSTSATC